MTAGEEDRDLARRPALAALGAVLLLAFGLRVWSIAHGLPWAYNPDEEEHFVPIAVRFFETFNPGYYQNPAALTWLLHALYRVQFLGTEDVRDRFLDDPRGAFLSARVLVAALGTAGVGLVYVLAARVADRRAGLVAAVVAATALLPLVFAKQALNDVPQLVPVTLALVGCLGVLERGGRRWLAAAAVATGVAVATKYLCGLLLVPLVLAVVLGGRARGERPARMALAALGAGGLAAFVVLVLNPYLLRDLADARAQIEQQASVGERRKLGMEDVPGWSYYARTLGWGLGWAPLVAALAGAVLAWRADRARAAVLLAFPLALFASMGAQEQYYARWLLPAYPVLCVLAGVAAVRAADRLDAGWRLPAVAALAVLLAAQGAVGSVGVSRLLGREDTRAQLRAWMLREVPAGTGIVAEPAFPERFWRTRPGDEADRWTRFPIYPPFNGYVLGIGPETIGRYRAAGTCVVVVTSHQRERGLVEQVPGALAYYRRLSRESDVLARFSPYRRGAEPERFNYDITFNYLDDAFERPGPALEVRRVRDCGGRP